MFTTTGCFYLATIELIISKLIFICCLVAPVLEEGAVGYRGAISSAETHTRYFEKREY